MNQRSSPSFLKPSILALLFAVVVASFFGASVAHAFDLQSPYSKNSIRVELEKGGELIRFSYCPERDALEKCALLGKGLYRVSDLKHFKQIQALKMTLNGFGLLGGVVVGVSTAAIGAFGTSAFPPAAAMVTLGSGMVIGAWKLGDSAMENVDHLYLLSAEFLAGKDVSPVDPNFTEPRLKEHSADGQFHRQAREALLIGRENSLFEIIHRDAIRLEQVLSRLDVEVDERGASQ
jgi:hypothetical protein